MYTGTFIEVAPPLISSSSPDGMPHFGRFFFQHFVTFFSTFRYPGDGIFECNNSVPQWFDIKRNLMWEISLYIGEDEVNSLRPDLSDEVIQTQTGEKSWTHSILYTWGLNIRWRFDVESRFPDETLDSDNYWSTFPKVLKAFTRNLTAVSLDTASVNFQLSVVQSSTRLSPLRRAP